ncbi:hypothetical protein ACEQ8H_002746 [Pleosporales sp. CAS-2024a]
MSVDTHAHVSPSAPALDAPRAAGCLHVVVIGAGLCGLGAAISLRLAGHAVTVVERVAALEEVGAGLQMTPNGTRLLRAWGVDALLTGTAAATRPATFAMSRFDGRPLARREGYAQELEQRHGSPLWCLHRADLQRALAERARQLGAVVRLDARVVDVDASRGLVELHGGHTLAADLVIAADGLWSTSRAVVADAVPQPTGQVAYRIVLERSQLQDARVAEHFATPGIHVWVGPGAHAVAYSVRGGRSINIVLLVPDDLPAQVAKTEGDVAEMHALFAGWDPILRRALDETDKVLKWRLHFLPPLPRWVSSNGRFLLAGDSAHAMLPYMGQGANSALEDAATIGALLSHVADPAQLAPALALYDAIRRPRLDQLVRETFAQGREHHLADGAEQVLRDAQLARSMMPEWGPGSDHPWTHPKIQPWIYGYDAYAEAEAMFHQHPF